MAGEAFGLAGDKTYDQRVIMTYPVDLRSVPEEQKAVYAEIAASGTHMVYYPGSIEGTCEDCQTAVYIGPSQQKRLATQRDAFTVLCAYCCAMLVATTEGAEYDFAPAGEDYNSHGIPRALVTTGPDAQGYLLKCAGCGREARMPQPPPSDKIAMCPDCTRIRG